MDADDPGVSLTPVPWDWADIWCGGVAIGIGSLVDMLGVLELVIIVVRGMSEGC